MGSTTQKAQNVTVAEAANLLHVSKATIRNWDRAGKLTANRHPLNSYRLYDISEIKNLQQQLGLFDDGDEKAISSSSAPDARSVRRLIAKLHSILRNTDSQSNIISRFDEITKLLFCKIMSQRSPLLGYNNPFHRATAIGDARLLRDFYATLAALYKDFIPEKFASIHASDEAIVECINALHQFDFDTTLFDIKGMAYEEVIRNTFDKGDHQQFFTPPHIVDFIVSMCEPFLHGNICDPASGTGGFLANVARRNLKYKSLTCFEIDERLSWVSAINLVLHGGKNIESVCLPRGGTLGECAKPYFGHSDCIITNPPFGSDFTDLSALNTMLLGKNKTSRRRGILFIERCHSLLKKNGLLAIILDEGVLNLGHAVDVRNFINEKFEIRAIVSLPETTFMPYANVNASILLLSKRSSPTGKQTVFFAKAENVGRKPNGDDDVQYSRDGMSHLNSDLPHILHCWGAYLGGAEVPDNPRVYVAKSLGDFEGDVNGRRLDFQYHHPSRRISQELIKQSAYPLKRLSDICSERNSTVIPAKELADTVIRYTGLAHIESGTGVVIQSATPANSLKSATKIYERGDIIFAKMRPNLRKVALMDFEESGYVSPECVVLTIKKRKRGAVETPVIDPLILSVLLRSDFVFGQIMHLVAGIGRPRIGVKELREVMIPIPPEEEQLKIKSNFLAQRATSERLTAEAENLKSHALQVQLDSVRSVANSFIGNLNG